MIDKILEIDTEVTIKSPLSSPEDQTYDLGFLNPSTLIMVSQQSTRQKDAQAMWQHPGFLIEKTALRTLLMSSAGG